MKYNIQGKEFKNKEEIKKYVRSMVDSYPDNTWLNPEDFNFIMEISKSYTGQYLKKHVTQTHNADSASPANYKKKKQVIKPK